MKKIFLLFIGSLLTTVSMSAAPKAVVFDWGNVLAHEDRNVVVEFMCKTLNLSEAEFETANLDKRKAVKEGRSDVDFWIEFAIKKGMPLPINWPESYKETLKASIGADPEMFAIIKDLKEKKIQTSLLSNINDRYTKLIRDFGFYDPFEPCLLSCEIGMEKPHPEAYVALLEAIQLAPDEIVFIDDKAENVEAAQKMGIDAIVFESPTQIRKELLFRDLLKRN